MGQAQSPHTPKGVRGDSALDLNRVDSSDSPQSKGSASASRVRHCLNAPRSSRRSNPQLMGSSLAASAAVSEDKSVPIWEPAPGDDFFQAQQRGPSSATEPGRYFEFTPSHSVSEHQVPSYMSTPDLAQNDFSWRQWGGSLDLPQPQRSFNPNARYTQRWVQRAKKRVDRRREQLQLQQLQQLQRLQREPIGRESGAAVEQFLRDLDGQGVLDPGSRPIPSASALPPHGSTLIQTFRGANSIAPLEVNMAELVPASADGEVEPDWVELENMMVSEDQQPPISILLIDPPDISLMGHGQYGSVWRAKRRDGDELFAVKNVSMERINSEQVAQREVEMLTKIRQEPHCCVIRVFFLEYFEEENFWCFCMEYCPGGDLKQRLKDAHTFDGYEVPVNAFLWLAQVFVGLEHLHLQIEVLMRDLKPDNVVLDAEGQAKLVDFGVGRLHVSNHQLVTVTEGFPGTPGYIAPEVLAGEQYDAKADLYSYAVLVWVMLTGGVQYSEDEDPLPPRKERTLGGGLEQLQAQDDWKLLADLVADEARSDGCSLPDDARLFVQKAVVRRPEKRPDHTVMRASEFFTWRLPGLGSSVDLRSNDVWEKWRASLPPQVHANFGTRKSGE